MASWTRRSALLAAAACGALAGTAVLAQSAPLTGNPERGKEISYTCLGCHGIEGYRNAYPDYSVPELRGQHPEYIVAALQAYKSGERSHTTMHAQASELSPQDMADIAVFFAGSVLKAGETPASAHRPPAAAAVCVACHGADGVGVIPQYPTIAGQHPDYIVQALKEYKSGGRKNPVMAGMAAQVKEDDMWVIADYYSKITPSLKTLPRSVSGLTVER
ncbi:MAG TPA: c-type cytochrome [Steroidobacteraceae bacterium]|nr:c-type cytochrome [Steroidobacteraceae bacterium]